MVCKLSLIVGYYGMWDVKPANDVLPYKSFDFCCCDGCQGFDLNPFREVVNSYQEELALSFSRREGLQYPFSTLQMAMVA